MKKNIYFIVILCIFIIDKLNYNIIDRYIGLIQEYIINKTIDFFFTYVLRKNRKNVKEKFIDKVIKKILKVLEKIPPFSWIIMIIKAILTMVEIIFLIMIILLNLINKIGVCVKAVGSINKATKSSKKTLESSLQWVKLLTYMTKTATKVFLSPGFWNDSSKITFLGKMMCDVRNQSYITKKLKEVSMADSKNAISGTIGTNGCLDLDVMLPPLKKLGDKIPIAIAPLIEIFKFLKPILGVKIPGMPKASGPDVYQANIDVLNVKYAKLMSEKCPMAGSSNNKNDSAANCPAVATF
jgi:hypothetical protein